MDAADIKFREYAKKNFKYIEFIQRGNGHRTDYCTITFVTGKRHVFTDKYAEFLYTTVREWTTAEFPNSNVTRYYP